MKIIRTALLAAVATMGIVGTAEAQTKYFAREMLAPGSSTPSTPSNETTAPPAQTKYNRLSGGTRYNTLTVNGCSYSNDATNNNLTSAAAAIEFCETHKAKYPNSATGYMHCTVARYSDGSYLASLSSAMCQAEYKGTTVYSGPGEGHYLMVADLAAYK